jgi:hypothetical protein
MSGTAKVSSGDPADKVYVMLKSSLRTEVAIPDPLGAWSLAVNEGDYLVIAEGASGYRPQTHRVVI